LKQDLEEKFDIRIFNLAQYMKLDGSAAKALNLLPSALDGIVQSFSSLLLIQF
jgi:hypothetical protein